MKQVITLAILAIMTLSTTAQIINNPFPKTITVNGSAQLEVVPDEIYVVVELKEYDKKGSGKISIDKIKAAFLDNARSIGIPDSAITIAAYDGDNGNPWLRKKKKKEELYASIAYQVKFSNSKKIDELVNRLDDEATQNFNIVNTSHSKIQEYRRQLKIQAIKAAKEKAGYLAGAIDEKVGEAVTITEPQEIMMQPVFANYFANKQFLARDQAEETTAVDFQKITLKFEINVVFALK